MSSYKEAEDRSAWIPSSGDVEADEDKEVAAAVKNTVTVDRAELEQLKAEAAGSRRYKSLLLECGASEDELYRVAVGDRILVSLDYEEFEDLETRRGLPEDPAKHRAQRLVLGDFSSMLKQLEIRFGCDPGKGITHQQQLEELFFRSEQGKVTRTEVVSQITRLSREIGQRLDIVLEKAEEGVRPLGSDVLDLRYSTSTMAMRDVAKGLSMLNYTADVTESLKKKYKDVSGQVVGQQAWLGLIDDLKMAIDFDQSNTYEDLMVKWFAVGRDKEFLEGQKNIIREMQSRAREAQIKRSRVSQISKVSAKAQSSPQKSVSRPQSKESPRSAQKYMSNEQKDSRPQPGSPRYAPGPSRTVPTAKSVQPVRSRQALVEGDSPVRDKSLKRLPTVKPPQKIARVPVPSPAKASAVATPAAAGGKPTILGSLTRSNAVRRQEPTMHRGGDTTKGPSMMSKGGDQNLNEHRKHGQVETSTQGESATSSKTRSLSKSKDKRGRSPTRWR